MASPINALGAASAASSAPPAASSALGAAPSEEMFLQLLVAQLQNQDPMNPADSTQFVSQLAQFSQLEQLIAIRGDLDKGGAAPATTTPPASGQTDNSQPPAAS